MFVNDDLAINNVSFKTSESGNDLERVRWLKFSLLSSEFGESASVIPLNASFVWLKIKKILYLYYINSLN